MARRRKPRTNAAPAHKRKGVTNRRNVFSGDRNRASPAPIIKLYGSLTPQQRSTIVDMGQGSFLDIKCEQLHNPVINWFVQCYEPATRSFVVPCRGSIPLDEESVHLMMGLPRGPLAVKYYADHPLEAQIAARLFPGQSSRPKVSEIGTMIAQYNEADNRFRELWMCFLISTVVAPTTDTKMSNKCYPMLEDVGEADQMNLCKFVVDELHDNLSKRKYTKGCLLYCMLRYFSALDTDNMELELGNGQFEINRWTKIAVDVIGEMDAQEYDTTTFGSMQLKDEFKGDLAMGMGLFGGADGFNSWMDLNTHPTCSVERKTKVFTLIQNFASNLNGLLSNLVQGLTESEANTCNNDNVGSSSDNEVEGSDSRSESESDEEQERPIEPPITQDDPQNRRKGKEVLSTVLETPMKRKGSQEESSNSASIPPMHSQINLPSDSDFDVADQGADQGDDQGVEFDGYSPAHTIQTSQQVNDQIRGSAASLAAKLKKLKHKPMQSTAAELNTSNKIKLIVARELGIPISPSPDDLDASKFGKTVAEEEQHVLEKMIISEKVNVPPAGSGCDGSNVSTVPTSDEQADTPFQIEEISAHKRKRKSLLSSSPPARKSPRIAEIQNHNRGDNVCGASADGNNLKPSFVFLPKLAKGQAGRKLASITEGRKSDAGSDGKTKKTAISVSPTVTKPPHVSGEGIVGGARKSSSDFEGRTKFSAIPISPTVMKSPVASVSSVSKSDADDDGKVKESAIHISPTVSNPPIANNVASSSRGSKSVSGVDGKSKENAISVSPTVPKDNSSELPQSENMCRTIVLSPTTQGNTQSSFSVSPFLSSNLRNIGLGRNNLSCSADHIKQLVRNLSDSVKKHRVLPMFAGTQTSVSGGSGVKRKKVLSSSTKERDNRPGMFTPPSYDLGISSPEARLSESPPAAIGSEEDAMPSFALDVAPLAWAESQGKGDPSVAAKGMGSESDLEEFKLSEEVGNFISNKSDYLSESGKLELTRYEEFCSAFAKRSRILQEAAAPQTSKDGSAIHSITPKVQAQKVRIRNPSRYVQSPFHASINVTAEEESFYQKLMLSSKYHRPSKSNIKKYQIIKYPNSWVYTGDLADSVHARGELSNHCMEVAIEYLQSTNKVEGKMIMFYQLSMYILAGEYQKKLIVSIFKRRKDYSLSVMKLLSFPVLQEAEIGSAEGNHWYVLCLNFEAGRFEALDSLRGEDSESLKDHANALLNNIKEVWGIHYADSKVQIRDYELQVINVPKQATIFDCGFHALHNIEKWVGQTIPPINTGDLSNMRKVLPYRWVTAVINESKDWKWHLDNNKLSK